ncbi:DNA-binding transcriptional regulator [Nostoc sp. NMS8]|uniref:helix-turn-helix domain-containing protein n=1 Tax=Nostoc sp. NMS8 TaxID=2815392 RepID=UPI0025E40EB7|nr:helix-turn-helix domain-containing protein [Nostoc sp. NMS8]
MTTTSCTPTEPRTDIGMFVHQLRHLLGLAQAQFAMQLKVAVPTIARWENNRTQPSTLPLMQLKKWSQQKM